MSSQGELMTWLRAQLDIDGQDLAPVADWGQVADRTGGRFSTIGGTVATASAQRVLDELGSKRKLLDFAEGMLDVADEYDPAQTSAAEDGKHLLRILALAYARRSGYREDWKP